LTRDAINARNQFPSLLESSGVLEDGKDGFTRGDLKRLEKLPLTAAQRAAVKFLKENYETLQTGRGIDEGGLIGMVSWPFGSSRITINSLSRHAENAKPTGGGLTMPEDPRQQRRGLPNYR
jgi:hypothetical protein